jgi:acyl carrier protein
LETSNIDLAHSVAALWAQALGVPWVEHDQHFFEIGGNSLAAVNLTIAIQNAFGVDLGITALFEFPTVNELVAELRRLGVPKTDG